MKGETLKLSVIPLPLVPTIATLFPAGTTKDAPSSIFLSERYLKEANWSGNQFKLLCNKIYGNTVWLGKDAWHDILHWKRKKVNLPIC